ncbi:MAG: T9SS type A sorting domain-containing protein [Saprospiraceae bacterium]|nr:T9SS type A sorting domain-containing protein [Saprospiraceae bacterium]
MGRLYFSILLIGSMFCVARAQKPASANIILLSHDFQPGLDNIPPTDTMLPAPNGDDQQWVNYDADLLFGNCLLNEITPGGWFWESDLGVLNPSQSNNFAVTSCSYHPDFPDLPAMNWLILPPLTIPDTNYFLSWKSLSFYGPHWMDGYKVLVSSTNNVPESGAFTDTIFKAAEMISTTVNFSLDVSKYTFSPGYIHAAAYTDTSYYFKDFSQGPPFYHGRLEPHKVRLKNYAGQKIYIAFLHDSTDDDKLQIDDILVAQKTTSQTPDFQLLNQFQVFPNPANSSAWCTWELAAPIHVTLQLADATGQVLQEISLPAQSSVNYRFDVSALPSGMYYCTLSSAQGKAVRKLVVTR